MPHTCAILVPYVMWCYGFTFWGSSQIRTITGSKGLRRKNFEWRKWKLNWPCVNNWPSPLSGSNVCESVCLSHHPCIYSNKREREPQKINRWLSKRFVLIFPSLPFVGHGFIIWFPILRAKISLILLWRNSFNIGTWSYQSIHTLPHARIGLPLHKTNRILSFPTTESMCVQYVIFIVCWGDCRSTIHHSHTEDECIRRRPNLVSLNWLLLLLFPFSSLPPPLNSLTGKPINQVSQQFSLIDTQSQSHTVRETCSIKDESIVLLKKCTFNWWWWWWLLGKKKEAILDPINGQWQPEEKFLQPITG